MFRRLILLFVAVVLLSACQAAPTLQDASESAFQVGGIWNYRARPGEEGSFLVITKVEEAIRGNDTTLIYHVYIDGVNITDSDGSRIEIIPHMPFTEEALKQSLVLPIQTTAELPDFQSGYENWRRAYLAGEAGVFNIPVAQAITNLEASLRHQ